MNFRFSLVLASAFVVTTVLSSCHRDFTCQCVIKSTGQPGLPDSVIKEYPIKDSKKNAKSACEANSGVYENGGITTTEDCHLF